MQLNEMFSQIRSGKAEREGIIRELYNDPHLQNGIRKIIMQNGGAEDDFHDILNYTLVQFLKGVMEKKELQVDSPINSYLFGIARNLWYQTLRKRKRLPAPLPENLKLVDSSPTIDLKIMDEERNKHLKKILDLLGKNCKEVLMLWAANFRMKEIARQLNYKSEGVVRKKKLLCMKELVNFLEDHPEAKKILCE